MTDKEKAIISCMQSCFIRWRDGKIPMNEECGIFLDKYLVVPLELVPEEVLDILEVRLREEKE